MKLLYLLTFIFLSSLALAQPGTVDKTYNADFGLGSNGEGAPGNYVQSADLQSDGSIIAVGSFGPSDNLVRKAVRYKPDGTLDASFISPVFTGAPMQVIVQPDNKIIVAGFFDTGVIRLNADGTVDQQFKTNIGTGAGTGVYSAALQSDGKILIGGSFQTFNAVSHPSIVRLNIDGTTDNGFNSGNGVESGIISSIGIQSTGKIVIAGLLNAYNGNARPGGIARINADGSIDAAFNPVGFDNFHSYIESILVLPNDDLIMGGKFDQYNNASRTSIVRAKANGDIETGFTSPFSSGQVYGIQLLPNDQILVGGSFGSPSRGVAILDASNGSFDNSFKVSSMSIAGGVYTPLKLQGGKFFIGGSFTDVNGTARNGVARLLSNGWLEGGRGANGAINTITSLTAGQIAVAGDFTAFRGAPRNRVARVTSTGVLDETLNPGVGANGSVLAMVKDANGKYIIAGNFTQYDGTNRARIARINSNGTLDGTFDPGTGANAIIRTLVLQADGAILIGGDFTSYDGTVRGHVARIETDGDVDPTFNPGTGADGTVQSITLQSTGKIIAAGSFTNYNGTARKYITRINTNGTIDATFDPGTGPDGTLNVVKADGNNNLLIGGNFTTYKDAARKGVARLTPDGGVDAAFSNSVDFRTVRTITIKADNNIFIGGDFTNKVALLSSNGTPNADFYPYVAPNGIVLSSIEDENGLIIASGDFTAYDGINVNRIVRILNTGLRDQTITFGALASKKFSDVKFDVSATSSSGLPVTFGSSDENIATVNGKTVTFVHAGTVNIIAKQVGDAKFNPAPDFKRELVITKGDQQVIFDFAGNPSYVFTGPEGAEFSLLEAAHATSGLTPITYRAGNAPLATITQDGTKLKLTGGTGGTFLFASQAGNNDWNPAPEAQLNINTVITSVPCPQCPGDPDDPDDPNDPVTGLEDEATLLIAYPNPTEGMLTVQVPSTHTGPVEAAILNTLGVSITQQVGQNLKFDMSSFPSGIYLLKVRSGKLNTVKRIYRK